MSEKEKEELNNFDAKIQQAQRNIASDGLGKSSSGMSGLAQGMRMATELFAGVAVGACVGVLIDNVFGTSPLFIVICLLFGTAAGIVNVYRASVAMSIKKDDEV